MEILMYGWEFPPHISGGLGIACHGIVTSLTKKGVKINLVLPRIDTDTYNMPNLNLLGCDQVKIAQDKLTTTHFDNTNLSTITLDALLHPYLTEQCYKNILNTDKNYCSDLEHLQHLFPVKITGQYGSNLLWEVMRYALVAGALAADVSHDIIHAHDWLTALAGIKAKRISGKPLVLHIHALEFDRCGENINQKIFAIEQYGMQQADRVIAVSNYTKNIILERYKIPAAKVEVVYNGVYESEQQSQDELQKPEHQMVLFLGRVTYQKGPWFFIEIAKKVLTRKPNVQFVIAGSGDMLKDMIQHVAASGVGKNVHFTGFLAQDAVKKLYHLADVYIMPSVSEPFGISCLEAISNNVPVILSKQSGVSEVLKHVLKSDFWDIDDMAAKILFLLEHPVLSNELATHSQQEIKYFTWDKTAAKLLSIYNTLQETTT
jgi:glycogen synthase